VYCISCNINEIEILAQMNNAKLVNKKLAKAIGLKLNPNLKDEAYDTAYVSRIVSVAINRKKKLAIDAIAYCYRR